MTQKIETYYVCAAQQPTAKKDSLKRIPCVIQFLTMNVQYIETGASAHQNLFWFRSRNVKCQIFNARFAQSLSRTEK